MGRVAWNAWGVLLLAGALTAAGCEGGERDFTAAPTGSQPEAAEVASATQALSAKSLKYDVIGLVRLPGTIDSRAIAINNNSEVVGDSLAPGVSLGFLWREGEGMQQLGFLPTDINDWGAIVGSAKVGSGPEVPVAWFAGQTYPLPTLSVGQGRAEGINNWFQIVGTLFTSGGSAVGWWWTGPPLDLGVQNSTGLGLNDLGVAVGGAGLSTTGEQGAWRWFGGALEYLPQTPSLWTAKKVNDAGVIIGNTYSDNYGAVIYSDGVAKALPFVGANPGMIDPTRAYGLNQNGDVVGMEYDYDLGIYAVLWPAKGKPVALNDLISKDARAEWNLRIAYDINDSMEIVGWGDHQGTHQEAFLLRPRRR